MPRAAPGSRGWVGWALVVAFDVLAIGMGMGVPIFAVLYGFAVGWYAARTAGLRGAPSREKMRRALLSSALVAGVTLLVMLAVWGPQAPNLSEPGFDAAEFGIPLILYTSTASFVGWLALMIVISPALQLLCSVFAAYVVAATGEKHGMEEARNQSSAA